MIENINLTLFIILSILLYSFLIKFILLNSIGSVNIIYNKAKQFIYSILRENLNLKKILDEIYVKVILPVRTIFIKALVYLKISCEGLCEFTGTLDVKFHSGLSQSVDYASLTIRKLYDGNTQLYIVYSAGVIVVFYFILSVL